VTRALALGLTGNPYKVGAKSSPSGKDNLTNIIPALAGFFV